MSYLSSSGNVGYSGLSQISEASCATQYKMGVEGTGMGPNDEADLSYYPHSEHLFGSKLKVDGAELFTFQDTDIIAGEITVCDDTEIKPTSPNHISSHRMFNLSNGFSDDSNYTPLTNGHLPEARKIDKSSRVIITRRSSPEKNNLSKTNSISEILASVGPDSPSGLVITSNALGLSRNSISSVNKEKQNQFSSTSTNQSFLDVFKKEMGTLAKNSNAKDTTNVKAFKPDVKPKAVKRASSSKSSSYHRPSKLRNASGGRGPAHHEALQRIPPAPPPAPASVATAPVVVATCTSSRKKWHAPGPHQFECAPLSDKKHSPQKSSSSDDDSDMPNFGTWVLSGADDAAAGCGEARGARLAARRATLRRQVAHAAAALRLTPEHRKQATLAVTVKKHLRKGGKGARLPSSLVKQLLASRDATSVLSPRDISILRGLGWSGVDRVERSATLCSAESCGSEALPCAAHCLAHVTLSPEQRLYARCAAVFADGARCRQPVLRLDQQTPLCREHTRKRDNYEKISREVKPKRLTPARKRSHTSSAGRSKRRPAQPHRHHSASHLIKDLSVCSNSSTYDSSEETGIGGLSDPEFMSAADHTALDVAVEQHVLESAQAPDDMLDSSVLNQIPDEAFTEFFNQGESGLCEGSEELKAALEAVLDERVLDSLDCVFTQPEPHAKMVSARSSGAEMPSSATS